MTSQHNEKKSKKRKIARRKRDCCYQIEIECKDCSKQTRVSLEMDQETQTERVKRTLKRNSGSQTLVVEVTSVTTQCGLPIGS